MKPVSLSVKNFLIRKLAVNLQVSEKVIEIVVNNQFSTILEMMKTCNSIELAGFGRFNFNRKKAMKVMEKYVSQKNVFENWVKDPQKNKKGEMRLQETLRNIEILKPKLDEY